MRFGNVALAAAVVMVFMLAVHIFGRSPARPDGHVQYVSPVDSLSQTPDHRPHEGSGGFAVPALGGGIRGAGPSVAAVPPPAADPVPWTSTKLPPAAVAHSSSDGHESHDTVGVEPGTDTEGTSSSASASTPEGSRDGAAVSPGDGDSPSTVAENTDATAGLGATESVAPLDAFKARVCERFRSEEFPFEDVAPGQLTDEYFEDLISAGELHHLEAKLTDPAKLSFNMVLHRKRASGTVTPVHVYWKHGDYRAGESAWNEALAYAVDRAFGFGLIPPTRMVRLDLDDMRRQLSAAATQRGETAAFIAGQMELVENWRSNAKENIKARWKRTKKYDLIGVNVLFYGWPFHDSSGPRDIEFDDEAKRVVDYNGDADEAKSFAEFNMLVWLCNCPRSAHGFFYDKPHKRWVMIDNDRCLGKRQQPFPKFLFTCQFPRDLVATLRDAYANRAACKMVKAFMKARDPVAAAEVIPRFKRKAGEHQSVEKPDGSCELNNRIKKLLDHVDWCHANRGGDSIYFERAAFGDVDDVRLATPQQVAAAKTNQPGEPKLRTIKKKGRKKKK